mmetsp:Transcript_49752/g.138184  ORF Transcript_49752/g.138184 Transcript_49752/m.138184 type:complete len:246 (-) Transcript_49752:105-842(-)
MSETRDATFRKALPNMCGKPASVGMPSSRLKAAMFEMPARNFWMRTVSLMSSTADGNTAPSWKIMLTSMPYSKGLMFNLPSRTAALGETFSPVFRIGNSDTSSIWPLTIFVPMFRAWKKFVWDGSIPVGPEGKFNAATATWPAFAADNRLCLLSVSWMSSSVQFVAKMKPMLPWMLARNLSMPASGCFSCPISKALRIIVFFPISTVAFPRSSRRMFCICFDATWSTLTMRALGELTHKSMSLLK